MPLLSASAKLGLALRGEPMPGRLWIGTSGYNYGGWRGSFYPPDLPSKDWLSFYAQHFSTVELNVTFYRLPRPTSFANWRAQTSEDFVFSLKGHRRITHLKKLGDVERETRQLFAHAQELKEKLAVVLWQFPPQFKADLGKLRAFCDLLGEVAPQVRQAFEFRHPSWFVPEVYALLEKQDMALCAVDAPDWPSGEQPTADFAYVRFHGRADLYFYTYSRDELGEWGRRISSWLRQNVNVFSYFNNTGGDALKNAKELLGLITHA